MTVRVNQPTSQTGSLRPPAARPPAATPTKPASAPAPRPRDQNQAQTGKLQAAPAVPAVDIEAVDLHTSAQAGKDTSVIVEGALQRAVSAAESAERAGAVAGAASKTTRGLGAAGVLTAMALLVKAVNSRPLKVAPVISALSDLAANMGTAAAGLSKIPGLDKALHVFGGIGGIVGGITGLVTNLQDAQKKGLTTSNLLGTMGAACSLVGGLAMALTPFAPPLAVVATAFTLAGAAFNVAKLAYDNREWIQKKAQGAVTAATGAVSAAVNTAKSALGAGLTRFDRFVAWTP
jgi:hypothetical protein